LPYRPGTITAFTKDTLERPDHFFLVFLSLLFTLLAVLAISVTIPWKRQGRPHNKTVFLKPIFHHAKLLGPKI
jgi:hypothetical protein